MMKYGGASLLSALYVRRSILKLILCLTASEGCRGQGWFHHDGGIKISSIL